MFIVRYADDFKIYCRNYNTAKRIFTAVKLWIKERLGLDISPEKSTIVNLRKKYSEFLGFKFKVRAKRKKYVVTSHISEKSKIKIKSMLVRKVKAILKHADVKTVTNYNATILGIHNYYKVATEISADFSKLAFEVNRIIYNRLKNMSSCNGYKGDVYKKLYGKYNFKEISIAGITLYPLAGISTKPPMNYPKDINIYSLEGRIKIHENIKGYNTKLLKYIMQNPIKNASTEYNDNRISLYIGQNGKCGVTGEILEHGDIEVHHKIPKSKGGTDKYKNLIIIRKSIHKLIHATNTETIKNYMNNLHLKGNQIDKLNKLRKMVGNCEI